MRCKPCSSPRAAESVETRLPSGYPFSQLKSLYHKPMTGFPASVGTMLWKTVCASLASLAWRGLQHDARQRGSTRKYFRGRLPMGYPRSDRLQSKTLPGSIARSVGTLPMNTTPALISRHSPALNSLKRFVTSSPAAGIALKT